jgi:hypothetical protein
VRPRDAALRALVGACFELRQKPVALRNLDSQKSGAKGLKAAFEKEICFNPPVGCRA